MTQPHQQRCYEIREDELIDVFAFLHDAPDFIQEIEGDIREHPCVTHTPAAPAMDALADLEITASMLYEFCEWFCDHNCEEKPCNVTVSRLHERLEGIKKQIGEHPEYLVKWNARRAEQKALLRGGGAP